MRRGRQERKVRKYELRERKGMRWKARLEKKEKERKNGKVTERET